jgi:hypothetical protein
MLPLVKITRDKRCQPRQIYDPAVTSDYAADLQVGAEFPPVVVFRDMEGVIWLADGFYRVAAFLEAGRSHIPAQVCPGELSDAVLYAAGCNYRHGFRRTDGDKRRAVMMVLRHEEGKVWADERVAAHCHVSSPLVAGIRLTLEEGVEDDLDDDEDEDDSDLEEELDEAEQILKCKGQVRRLCAKLDRHARTLGTTTEALVQMYRSGELEPVVLAAK